MYQDYEELLKAYYELQQEHDELRRFAVECANEKMGTIFVELMRRLCEQGMECTPQHAYTVIGHNREYTKLQDFVKRYTK